MAMAGGLGSVNCSVEEISIGHAESLL